MTSSHTRVLMTCARARTRRAERTCACARRGCTSGAFTAHGPSALQLSACPSRVHDGNGLTWGTPWVLSFSYSHCAHLHTPAHTHTTTGGGGDTGHRGGVNGSAQWHGKLGTSPTSGLFFRPARGSTAVCTGGEQRKSPRVRSSCITGVSAGSRCRQGGS